MRALKRTSLIFGMLILALSVFPLAAAPVDPPPGTAYWRAPGARLNDSSGLAARGAAFQPRSPAQPAAFSADQAASAIFSNTQVSLSGNGIPNTTAFVNDFSEPHLSVDPTNPAHFVGGSKFFTNPAAYQFRIGVFESLDGGLTWSEQQLPGTNSYSLTSDVVTAFDRNGQAYANILTRGPAALATSRLPLAGGIWSNPVQFAQNNPDKNWIAVDADAGSPYAGHAYVCWYEYGSGSGVRFIRSTDGGLTWVNNRLLSSAGANAQGCIVAVAPGGDVVVLWANYSLAALESIRSTDGGATFGSRQTGPGIVDVPYVLPNGSFRNSLLPAFTISPSSGTWLAAWNDYRSGDTDILASRSTDNGATWSAVWRVNRDLSANGIDQIQPQISVAPNGRVAIAWFDRRLPCPPDDPIVAHRNQLNTCIDTYLTRSFDDGVTYGTNWRVSTATWEPALNAPCPSGNCSVTFIGDYQGLASTAAADHPFWNATADLGQNPLNYQQIFTAPVPACLDADVDCSGLAGSRVSGVDVVDIQLVASRFGQNTPPAPSQYDFNGNGQIDVTDIAAVAAAW